MSNELRLRFAESFIANAGLTGAYGAFLEKAQGAHHDSLRPAFEIERREWGGGRPHKYTASMNITPWLRTASIAYIEALIAVDEYELPDFREEETDQTRLLDTIWNASATMVGDDSDYGELEGYTYHGHYLDLDELRDVLKEIRPDAYRALLATPEEEGQMHFDLDLAA